LPSSPKNGERLKSTQIEFGHAKNCVPTLKKHLKKITTPKLTKTLKGHKIVIEKTQLLFEKK